MVLFLIIFPPKAPPPNNAFGKLPAIKFPAVATPSAQLVLQLETIQGAVPKASESAAVYFMPKTAPNLLSLNKAQEFATRLEFNPAPIQESKNIYRFNDAQFPLRRLRYDIVSGNFILRYAFERDPSVFVEKNLPLSEAAKIEAMNLLQSYDLYQTDLEEGATIVTFWRLQGEQLVPTSSLSQADAVRVDFFRKPIADAKIFTPVPDEAPVSLMLSGSANAKKHMLQFAYTFWPIDYQTSATYALKTSDEAWAELQATKSYIARYPTGGGTAVVRNVYVGYYDSFEPQTYLQPIFVFEGDNGFLAYVPAVAAPWTE
ncbi:MAG: hypothetical protein UY49_C0038G0005 [Microgenomates group bacterium GW2011_GWC1_49_7]|nr:MAG: hypothetical protein UY49_C0038G0005 [Microgenomates group bacterium GW2011_GWC1_49_7]